MKTRVCPRLRGYKRAPIIPVSVLMATILFVSCGALQRATSPPSQSDTSQPPAEAVPQQPSSGIQYSTLSSNDIAGQFPYALTYDRETATLFYADILNNVICRKNADGSVDLINQSVGLGLSTPLALDHVSSTMLVIADTGNKRICGLTFDGSASELLTTNGRVTGVVVVPGDAIYYSNYDACTVMKSTAEGSQTAVAGMGSPGYSGDGGPATSAALNGPYGLAYHNHQLYIADSLNHRIRVLDLQNGTIQTFAGNGTRGTSIPSSPMSGLDVALNEPRGVSVDEEGNVYISNTFGNSILCFDSKGQLLPEMVKTEWTENDRPVCAVPVDGRVVYTDLVTPGIRAFDTAKAVPEPQAKAQPKPKEQPQGEGEAKPKEAAEPKEKPDQKPSEPAPQAKEEGEKPQQVAQAPAEPKPQPKPPAEKTPQPKPPAEKPEPPRPTGPKTTRAYLIGPERVLDQPSVTYTLCVDLKAGTDAAGIVSEVRWQPDHFELISVVPHQGSVPNSRRTHLSERSDGIAFTVHTRAGTPALSGTVELVDLLFKCVWDSEIPTVSTIEVEKPTILAFNGTQSREKAQDFTVTNFLYGDVNHDSQVDMVDAVLVLKKSESQTSRSEWAMHVAGDVDLDGRLTIADAFSTSRRAADRTWDLPTLPPRNKAKWSSENSLLQDALIGETVDWDEVEEHRKLQDTWTKQLTEEAAALFVQVPGPIGEKDEEVLLDLVADLPEGIHLGAFETAVEYDTRRISVEKVLLEEQGPLQIVGTAEIGEGAVHLGGICRAPGDATETTVKLATLLVRLNPPDAQKDWNSSLRPVARELIDYNGEALLGFGVPTRIRGYRPGDVNRDGKADNVDVLLLLESLTGKNEAGVRSSNAADMDDDGTRTIRDAILLFRTVEGEDLFDVTDPAWKEIAADYRIRGLFEREGDPGLLPPMVDLISRKTRAKSMAEVAKTHSILGLDGPPTPGESGHFLGTILYQPRPGSSLGGYLQSLECDPAVTIESVMPAPAMESINQPLVYRVSSDRKRIEISQILDMDLESESRPVTLASILFKMSADADDSITSARIRLLSEGVVDRFGRPVDVVCPSHTVSNFIPGDVNRDGTVERLDEVLLMRVVAGEVEKDSLKNPDAADLNLDGEVDISDVVLLEQATLGEQGEDVIRRARRRSAILEEINETHRN